MLCCSPPIKFRNENTVEQHVWKNHQIAFASITCDTHFQGLSNKRKVLLQKMMSACFSGAKKLKKETKYKHPKKLSTINCSKCFAEINVCMYV